MSTAIIDYGSGNLRSVEKALEKAARSAGLDQTVFVTSDADAVARADRILLPGVGAFGDCINGLRALDGMIEAMEARVHKDGVPFMGICVGMQLLARESHEHGTHQGLGWIDGVIEKITPADPALKVPHMGWNEIRRVASHPVTDAVADGAHCYFANSYHMVLTDQTAKLAEVDYAGPITAAVGKANVLGVQFHPEKSQAVGAALLENFLRWTP
mgnify:FL=1